MVATAEVRTPASYITTLGATSNEVRLSNAFITAIYNVPTAGVRATAAYITALAPTSNEIRTSSSYLTVLVRGHRENRKLRAWGFSLDGHDFYVLRLGETSTLVYDLTTNQWTQWASPSTTVLRAHLGLNWQGQGPITIGNGFPWNVIGGDDSTGVLWILDPNKPLDHDYFGTEVAFNRKVIGNVPMRMRETVQCGAVYLIGSVSNPSLVGDGITLKISDDNGFNFTDMGTVVATVGDVNQEIGWIGLGVMKAPGRLFLLQDTGALARISSLDIRS
jgi:hypothetical protein